MIKSWPLIVVLGESHVTHSNPITHPALPQCVLGFEKGEVTV